MNPNQLPTDEPIIENVNEEDNVSGEESDVKPSRRSGRRKIKIEYIEDKNRRHITFSKRKAGIMKKAYELSTLTGTQVLLLVVSETGLVYTFTTVKLQPIVTKPEGKNLIQACLNAPDTVQGDSNDNDSTYAPPATGGSQSKLEVEKIEAKTEPVPQTTVAAATSGSAGASGYGSNSGPYQQQQPYGASTNSGASGMPPMSAAYGGHPNYMNPAYHQQQQSQQPQQQSPQQQQQQQPYGQMPGSGYYGSQQQQQPQYMSHPGQQQQQQQQQHHGYWPNNPASPSSRQQQQQQEDDSARRSLAPKN
ncbi:hypothetical protein MBANPS3_000349 [Mucor bainieri]